MHTEQVSILWVDDEVDLLKPHIMFLEGKGYQVDTVTNGDEALDMVKEKPYHIVFLDENMPGLSGLETLSRIKDINESTPVVMITKSEEEKIMEEAIGSKIADYLIKPVNPNQILLSVKKNLDTRRLVSEKTTSSYQQEFTRLSMEMNQVNDYDGWADLYKKLVKWELNLVNLEDSGMQEILATQKKEANAQFFKYVKKNYTNWLESNSGNRPVLSPSVMNDFVFPKLKEGKKMVFVLIDNLRLDQWLVIKPMLETDYRVQKEETFFSILPTATHYARNALFAGLMPMEIKRQFPKLWKNENDQGSKNAHEEELLQAQLQRHGLKKKMVYHKITQLSAGKKLADQVGNLMQNDLSVIVYNFVDMLSHAKTEMEVIRELAGDDKAYRDLTRTWFENSPLKDLLHKLSDQDVQVVLTTDHGTIHVQEPVKVVGDRNTNTNLRYKVGRNLSYNAKDVLEINNPESIRLPKEHVSSSFIFAKEDDFFAYPNNFNHYVNYYRNTFQHGGISLEEMIVPLAILNPR